METLAERLSQSLELVAEQGATAEDIASAQRLWTMALEIASAVEGKLPRGGGTGIDISLGWSLTPGALRTLAALSGTTTRLQVVPEDAVSRAFIIESVDISRYGARIRGQGSRPIEVADLERLQRGAK